MFDYCIYRREEWLDECIANQGDVDLPDWGDVYNFDNMHADLESNEDTNGDWENQTCDAYYVLEEILDESY